MKLQRGLGRRTAAACLTIAATPSRPAASRERHQEIPVGRVNCIHAPMASPAPSPPRLRSSRRPLRLRKPDRRQVLLRPCSLEELLAPDHPARMGWAITERFDLEKFLTPIRAREGHAGRDATDPQVLVALWLYAAIDGVGSARDGECRDQGLPRLGAAVGRIGRIFDRCVLAGMTRRNRTHLREGSVRRCRTYGYWWKNTFARPWNTPRASRRRKSPPRARTRFLADLSVSSR